MAENFRFITKADEKEIIEAIETAESQNSGEIRVHLEPYCKDELHTRAQEVFYKLNMQQTKRRNGVLIYLAVNDRKFYILGDKGIHEKVPEDFWESTKDVMQSHFKKGQFKEGLIEGILLAGRQLKEHFPHTEDDTNELSDEISRGA